MKKLSLLIILISVLFSCNESNKLTVELKNDLTGCENLKYKVDSVKADNTIVDVLNMPNSPNPYEVIIYYQVTDWNQKNVRASGTISKLPIGLIQHFTDTITVDYSNQNSISYPIHIMPDFINLEGYICE